MKRWLMCTAPDCTKPTVAKGLCRKHYDAQRWELVGRNRTQAKAKAAGIEIERGRVWVDDSGFTQVVVCELCGRSWGPWVEDYDAASRLARVHRDEHRDRTKPSDGLTPFPGTYHAPTPLRPAEPPYSPGDAA